MLRLSIFCMLLALVAAQNGYDYNKPSRPFGPGTSSQPGTSPGSGGTTIRPQSDDYNGGGSTTGYSTGPQNYPGSGSQRPGYPGSSYPGQGPSGPSGGYPGQSDSSYPQGSRGPSGSGYPGQGSRYPGQGQNYPGSGNNYGTTSFSDSDTGSYEGGDYSAIPGEPDIDYPILSYIPQTSFSCKAQSLPGYYADVETRCQVFHVCSNNITYDFLCPNGTIFSQEDFVCVWWNQFSCDAAPGLYELNAKLYDYSIRGSDYNDYNTGSSYPGGRGPQGPSSYPGSGTSRPSSYPGSGPSTPYPGIQSTSGYPGPQGPSGGYPGSQGPSGGYPGSQGPSGSYPGSQGPSGGYPGSQGPSGGYPGSQGPSGGYPGSQGPSGSYPGYPGSGPQGPSGSPGSPGSNYPSSSTPYPGSGLGSQGYPSGRPSGPGFNPNGSRGRPAQKPNREYLPPRN
ncbi:spidroin-2 [Helicoverpa armigera]|uniref:spidroin-2 n=1 Tax=Helicoverpa armigera TaxID=29058 RepID=UPI003082D413